jgi:CheY-like chemotaxis protein
MNQTAANILLVEDDDDYAFMIRHAFQKEKVDVNLHHVSDGKKCLDFLRREGTYAEVPTPDLVLMDLDMPGMDGRQALAKIVADDALKHLPVVILTSREERDEILRMYQLRCSSYIRKPSGGDGLQDFVRKFAAYWLSIVMLPRHPKLLH